METEGHSRGMIFYSRSMYLFFFIIFLLGLIYSISYAYLNYSILSIIIQLLLTMFLYHISLQYQYEISYDKKIFSILILLLVLLYIGYLNAELILIFRILIATVPIIGCLLLPFSTFTYRMSLHYNPVDEILTIKSRKLFSHITEEYTIPKDTRIRLMKPGNPLLLLRKSFYSRLQINEQIIYFAPVHINGFEVPNAIIELFRPQQLFIDGLPQTNTALVIPKPRIHTTITLPRNRASNTYHNPEVLENYVNQENFRKLLPREGIFGLSQPIFVITVFVALLNLGISALIKYYPDIVNETDKLIQLQEIFQYGAMIILLGIITIALLLTIANLVTIWLGELSINVNDTHLTLSYAFQNLNRVDVNIHRFLDPKVNIENNIILLVLLNDSGYPYYQHRIGEIKES